MAVICHSTIVRSPNPTSPLRNFVRQLHASFTILPASNRHILPSKLLVCWTFSLRCTCQEKNLVTSSSIVHQTVSFSYSWILLKHALKEKKTKTLLDKKNSAAPVKPYRVLVPSIYLVYFLRYDNHWHLRSSWTAKRCSAKHLQKTLHSFTSSFISLWQHAGL